MATTTKAAEARVNTSIKHGRETECSWNVFEGTVAQNIHALVEAYGVNPQRPDGSHKLLCELTEEAADVAVQLRGSRKKRKSIPETTVPAPPYGLTASSDPPAQEDASEGQPEEQTDDVNALIDNAISEEALNDIWTTHKDKFDDDVIAKFKAKRDEIQKEQASE